MLQQIQQLANGFAAMPYPLTYISLLKKYLFVATGRDKFNILNNDGTYSASSLVSSTLSLYNIGYGKDSAGMLQIYAITRLVASPFNYFLYKVNSALALDTTPLATYSTVNFFMDYQSIWIDETATPPAMYGAASTGIVTKFNLTTGAVISTYSALPVLSTASDNFIMDISNFDNFKAWQDSTNTIFEGKLSTGINNTYVQDATVNNLAWDSDLGKYRQVDVASPYYIRDYKPVQAVTSITATKNDISQQNSGFVLNVLAKDSANNPVPNAPIRTRIYGLNIYKSVTSITRVGSTATVTSTAHGYINGDIVYIPYLGQYLDQPTWGINQVEYSGFFTVANAATNTFDITVTGTPATPATGTIIVARTTTAFGSLVVAPILEAGKIFQNLAINITATTDITMTTDANGQINYTYVNSMTTTGTDVFRHDSL